MLDQALRDYDFGSLHGYKTKGVVKYYVELSSREDVVSILNGAMEQGIRTVACGGGSNIIIKDYFDGLFIKWTGKGISVVENNSGTVLLQVSSAVTKEELTNYCIEHGLGGLEFWAGIPGLVGGGVAMNAGAYDSQCQDVVEEIEVAGPNGIVRTRSRDLKWHYRKVELPYYAVVLSTTFRLKSSDTAEVRKRSQEHISDRENKHPLEFPSCGSVFKNPICDKDDAYGDTLSSAACRPKGKIEGTSKAASKGAWWYIREAGLSGFSVGGAKVSPKHTNFVINAGGATASDVINLINEIKKRVKDKFNVQLEEEVRIF